MTKEKQNAYMREYRARNAERLKQQQKEYMEKNKDRINAYYRDYNKTEKAKQALAKSRENNRDSYNAYARDYAKKKREENKRIKDEFNQLCKELGIKIEPPDLPSYPPSGVKDAEYYRIKRQRSIIQYKYYEDELPRLRKMKELKGT